MAKAKRVTRFFHGETELAQAWTEDMRKIRALHPEAGKLKRIDSFSAWVGGERYSRENFLPVTRIVHHNPAGSLHKCGSRCRSAKGSDCECSCRGEFHGAGN